MFLSIESELVMFFKSKKRISEEISSAIVTAMRPHFVGTEYFSNGGWDAPPNFWYDRYILGVAFGIYTFLIKYQFKGHNMTSQKRSEIFEYCLDSLCGQESASVMRHYMSLMQKDDSELRRGVNDAATMFLVAMGKVLDEDDDPILVKAREISSDLHDITNAMPFGNSANGRLLTAVQSLTLGKHIENKFLCGSK